MWVGAWGASADRRAHSLLRSRVRIRLRLAGFAGLSLCMGCTRGRVLRWRCTRLCEGELKIKGTGDSGEVRGRPRGGPWFHPAHAACLLRRASHDFGGRHGAPRGGGGRRAGRGGGRGQRVSRGLHRPRPRGRGRVRKGERRPRSRAGAGDQARARVRVEAEGWPLQRPPSVMPRARASVQGSFDEGPSTACRLDAPIVPPPKPFGPAPWPQLPLRRRPRQDRRVC